MKYVVSALVFVLTLGLVCAPILAENVSCGPEYVKQTSASITEVTKAVQDAIAQGRLDEALGMLGMYDQYKLSPDGADARYSVAKALRAQGRAQEAVALLKANVTGDPYNRVTPESLALLASILYFDVKDTATYGEYLTKLAVNYFPGIPIVTQARATFGEGVPDPPVSQRILLDESLGESSIFTRSYLGSSNFCQWDVIRTLGEAGFTVHDNGWITRSTLTPEIMGRYGLIIMNGGPTDGRAIPDATAEAIAAYVKNGGKLLVICASSTLGSGKMHEFYNPLMSKFGMQFDGSYTTGNSTRDCSPAGHALMKGVEKFRATFGIRVKGGTSLGTYGSDTLVAMKKYGSGTVVAAGIGSGLQGNTIGDLYRDTPAKKAEAQINRTFVLKLVQNLVGSR